MALIHSRGLETNKRITASTILILVSIVVIPNIPFWSGTLSNWNDSPLYFSYPYVLASVLVATVWWVQSKFVGIRIGLMVARLTSVGRRLFLATAIQEAELDAKSFLGRFFGLAASMFALDLLFTSVLYPEGATGASFISWMYVLGILSFIVPTSWVLEDIGLRSYSDLFKEIRSVSAIFEKVNQKIVTTGAFIGSLLTILLSSESIDEIPMTIWWTLNRSIAASLIITVTFALFFQALPDKKVWKAKKIPMGSPKVTFGK